MNDNIYLVTRGEYSSYHVIAAFTVMKDADDYAAVQNANGDGRYEVERVDLDPPLPDVVRKAAEVIKSASYEESLRIAKERAAETPAPTEDIIDNKRASVPLATPMEYLVPVYLANSCSKAETSGPRIYIPEFKTRLIAESISFL